MTTAVGDGPSAVALARDEDFDLLILDLGLPVLDGTEVLRTLRAQGRRLPVIILSARDDVRDKVAGLQLGADDYLTKPFELDELLARVQVRLRDAGTSEPLALRAGGVALDLRTRRATVDGRTSSSPRASSRCWSSSCATPTRCSAASRCWRTSGATTSTPAPMSSRSTSATCAASWGRSTSPPCAGWATGFNLSRRASPRSDPARARVDVDLGLAVAGAARS